MVSIATKISTFTMLSTMALASDFGNLLNNELKVIEDAIKDLNTKHAAQ